MTESDIQSGDYISLGGIKNALLDFFSLIFRGLDFIIASVNYKKILFFLCCVAGVLSGYLYYWLHPAYYETEMIVYQNDLTRKTYYEIIDNLNGMLLSQSYTGFASELQVPESLPQKVLHIEAVGVNNESLQTDTSTKAGQTFKIYVKTNDNTIIKPLQNALLHYMNTNEYVAKRKEGEKKIYQQKLQFINMEQQRLDSLKEIYNRTLSSSMKMPTTFYNNALDPAELYRQSSILDNQKEQVLKWFNNEAESVILIDGFKSPANPQSLSLKIPLLIGLAAGIVLGLILSLLAAVKNKVARS